jgi:hypothetical protein
LDWNRALHDLDQPLPPLTFGEIRELITLIGEMIHRITSYLWGTGCAHEWVMYDGAEKLFETLKAGFEKGSTAN